MSSQPGLTLQQGMEISGLSFAELWLRQISVTGTADELELEAYILGLLRPDPFQHNLIAQALNEHFLDHGGNHPVGYWEQTSAP